MKIAPLSRILLVDDEEDMQVIARMALETIGGFAVEICSSGSEALQKAPAFAPDLILLDVLMPEMDGPSTFKALGELAQTATTPVVFMTAKTKEHEIAQLIQLGALDVIAKPFDPTKLAAKVNTIWVRHHSQDRS